MLLRDNRTTRHTCTLIDAQEGRTGAEQDHLSVTPKGVILTLTYVRSVSTSSQMTLRSLSASESCLGVAGGGKGESGLGEEETHSEGFISCRLRQKAATCSVLCKSKTGTNTTTRSQMKAWRIRNSRGGRTWNVDLQVLLPPPVGQESTAVQRVSLERRL